MGQFLDDNFTMLKKKLDRMGQLVYDSVSQVLEALSAGDQELASLVVEKETSINLLEAEIDDLVLKLLALQHPTAVDLRFVITGMKITNDLERMGDQACKVATAMMEGADDLFPAPASTQVEFEQFTATILATVRNCIRAYTTDDLQMARSLVENDRGLNLSLQRNMEILVESLANQTLPPDQGRLHIHICHQLARLADLTHSVARNVVFYVEGKVETGEVEPIASPSPPSASPRRVTEFPELRV
jgi:phosphate transport system protein